MVAKISDAVNAYRSAAERGLVPGVDRQPPGMDFQSMLTQAARDAVEVGKSSERMTGEAIAGRAELSDVVAAVGNAEMTLQTVVALRDRVVQAYQEIMRMPI